MTFTAGGTDVKTAFLGSTALTGVFVGDKKVWPTASKPTHPSTAATLPSNPYGMAISPDGKTLYVCLQKNSLAVVDIASGSVLTSIPTGPAYPIAAAASPDGKKVYVATQAGNTVVVIDAKTNTHLTDIPVSGNPYSFVVSTDSSTVYCARSSENSVAKIDVATSAVTAIANAAPSNDVIFSADHTMLYSANTGDPGSVSLLSLTGSPAPIVIPAGTDPRSVVLSPDGKKLYCINSGPGGSAGSATVISTARKTVLTTIPLGVNPRGAALLSSGFIYVACFGDATVSVIDTATDTATTSIPVGRNPWGVCAAPDGLHVYVANYSDRNVSLIS